MSIAKQLIEKALNEKLNNREDVKRLLHSLDFHVKAFMDEDISEEHIDQLYRKLFEVFDFCSKTFDKFYK
jgi:hypothetical protein